MPTLKLAAVVIHAVDSTEGRNRLHFDFATQDAAATGAA